jgi:hypothetical protein
MDKTEIEKLITKVRGIKQKYGEPDMIYFNPKDKPKLGRVLSLISGNIQIVSDSQCPLGNIYIKQIALLRI